VQGTNVHLEWPCFTNACFRIDSSTNLFTWETIGTSINYDTEPVTNTIVVIDFTAGLRSCRYYRVVPVDTNGVRLP